MHGKEKKGGTDLETRKINNYFPVEVEVIKPRFGTDGRNNAS